MTEDDATALLARRAHLLRSLRDGPRPKQDLVAAQSMSRSTVDRAVRTLEARGFVERNGGVALTLRGRLALDAYDEFVETLDALEEAGGLLDVLPADATVDSALLHGANVVQSDPVAPQRPYVTYQSIVEDATAVRGFAPAVLDENVSRFHDRIVDGRARVDLTVAPAALDELLSSHADVIEDALDTGRLTLREATTVLDYALVVVEQPERTVACALFFDDHGIAGMVENDEPHAVEWADEVYESIRADADLLHG
ncbi:MULTISPECIES: winged helix-turn-helix domain-containing protein [Halobacterium]|uniref:helix-turn-helix transcriptional regulator n=1 Tax=Halobacterium TaxID=2239 RepID=UPI00073F9FB3|nr:MULTISPECIES: helix-turn-helix domain-containing protein [Halobacterium]MCG1002738.1 helix-turn-helix domain-containing protein [Halobacterium noricense]